MKLYELEGHKKISLTYDILVLDEVQMSNTAD